MAEESRGTRLVGRHCETTPGFLRFAGFRLWTFSLLPALVGTTLPFWLRPPGFSFRWLGAIEFLIATILFHAGFSFLYVLFARRSSPTWRKSRLLWSAGLCFVIVCILGLHVNNGLILHSGVPRSIFIIFGLSALFAGMLYVAPPFNFSRRVGGEVVLAGSLGLIPVLGAYLVQVGDITRTVYLAAFPLVVATALWVWTDELATRIDDEKLGRKTMVILFGPRFSGRFVVLALSVLLGATLFAAILSASITPWALVAVLSFGLVWRVVVVSWKEYASPTRLLEARKNAFILHLATCLIITASSLVSHLRSWLG